MSADQKTAAAFATSWNHFPVGSIYTKEQFDDELFQISKTRICAAHANQYAFLWYFWLLESAARRPL